MNKVQCLKCKDTIESRYRHDFISCKCGAIFTDGGNEYIRRGGDPDLMIDLGSDTEETRKENAIKAMAWDLFPDE